MPKISDYAAVTDVLGTDEYVLARAGVTKKIDAADLLGAWQAYTPTLGATTTPPTLGTGGSVNGRWIRIGKMVWVNIAVIFGTSGVANGNGNYTLSLPVAVGASVMGNTVGGSVFLFDQSSGTHQSGTALVDTSTDLIQMIPSSTTSRVGHIFPWTWAVNDQLHVGAWYEID